MELTKQDIQKIDKYLEKEIRYWDVRLEMIDHLASRLEDNNEDINIDATFLRETFGPYWKMKKEEKNRIKQINKKYKRLFFGGFIKLLNKPINLFLFGLLFLLSVLLYTYTSYKIFWNTQIAIISVPLFEFFILSVFKHKITFNSIIFGYITHYMGFSIFIFSQISMLFKEYGFFEISKINQVYLLSFLFILNLFWIYNGVLIFKNTLDRIKFRN